MNLKSLSLSTLCLMMLLLQTSVCSAKELWVYCQANLLVVSEIQRVEALMNRAAPLGYTHFLIADSKFARLKQLDERYFANVEKLKATAQKLQLKIVPAVHPVGYSNELLSLNPNLAEGLPVIDAPFTVHNGAANIDTEATPISLPSLADRKKWGFIDDSYHEDGDAITSTAPHSGNTRCMQQLQLKPHQHYHVSVMVKTNDFNAPVEIKPIDGNGRVLSYTYLRSERTQDWTQHHITFNSLDATKVNLYIGAWGPTTGTLSLKEPKIELAGAVNLLRRSTTPIQVKIADKQGGSKQLVEGTDFEVWADPRMGVIPYEGEYEVWHEAPPIKLKRPLADGTKLLVSYCHTHIVHDGQVCGAINTQAFQDLLIEQSALMSKLFSNNDFMMSHDEYRVMNWTVSDLNLSQDSAAKNEVPSQLLSHNVKVCFDSLKKLQPKSRVYTWNDMFDPYHNAVNNYYLVNGTLEKVKLPRDVVVMNWNAGRRDESLRYFADAGHHQVAAGYYDNGPDEIVGWLDTLVEKKIPSVDGVMYTTWQRNFSDLEAFAANVKKHAWFANN